MISNSILRRVFLQARRVHPAQAERATTWRGISEGKLAGNGLQAEARRSDLEPDGARLCVTRGEGAEELLVVERGLRDVGDGEFQTIEAEGLKDGIDRGCSVKAMPRLFNSALASSTVVPRRSDYLT